MTASSTSSDRKAITSTLPGRSDCIHVVLQDLRQLARRRAAKPAIGGEPKIRQHGAGRSETLLEGVHAVDHAEEDPCAAGLQACERSVKRVVGSVQRGDMNPVDAAAGGLDRRV